jgi:hypothetical protein
MAIAMQRGIKIKLQDHQRFKVNRNIYPYENWNIDIPMKWQGNASMRAEM